MLTVRARPAPWARARGVTLVEILVAMGIFVMLLFMAAPDFSAWIQGTRMRTVAEALQNGVRQAQAEALRRNRTVVFFLTNAEPAIDAASVANGSNWGMRTLPLFAGDAAEFIRGGSLSDVADGVVIAGPAALCFNAAGSRPPWRRKVVRRQSRPTTSVAPARTEACESLWRWAGGCGCATPTRCCRPIILTGAEHAQSPV